MIGFLQNKKESHQNPVKKTKGKDTDLDNIFKIYQKKSLYVEYQILNISILKRQSNQEITEEIEQTLQKWEYTNDQDAQENVSGILWKMKIKSIRNYYFTQWNGKNDNTKC